MPVSYIEEMAPRILLMAIVLGIACGVIGTSLVLKDERPRLNRYVNAEHGYAFVYPDGWELTEGATQCDPEVWNQVTEIKRDGADAYFFLNFNGGWCESTGNIQRRQIDMARFEAEEFICPGFGVREAQGARDAIIWYLKR